MVCCDCIWYGARGAAFILIRNRYSFRAPKDHSTLGVSILLLSPYKRHVLLIPISICDANENGENNLRPLAAGRIRAMRSFSELQFRLSMIFSHT